MTYIFPKAVDMRSLSAKRLTEVKKNIANYKVTRKLDGCTLVIKFGAPGSEPQALSGDGHVVRSADHIIRDFQRRGVPPETTWVGEAWSPDTEFTKLSGDFRRHSEGTYGLYLFDACYSGASWAPLPARRELFIWLLGAPRPQPGELIQRAPHVTLNNTEKLALLDGSLTPEHQPGYDGYVLHDVTAPWVDGRSKTAVIKVKPLVTLDLEVVDVVPGLGKHAGRIGALVCRGSFGTVSVGTGLSDADRDQNWIGQIVEIACLGQHPSGIPREPRLIRRRPDKTRDQVD